MSADRGSNGRAPTKGQDRKTWDEANDDRLDQSDIDLRRRFRRPDSGRRLSLLENSQFGFRKSPTDSDSK